MTQTATPAAKPAPSVPPATEDVPRLLNRLQVVAVVACVLFGLVTAGMQVLAWQANRAAADNTEQLVRVQNIQSTLFRADALATNAFLIGGLEPPEQRRAYDDAVDQVSRSIADAAEAQPADRRALAALNTTVTQYAATMEQARANNRQGFPVGAEYLRSSSSRLRAEALPIVGALVDANAKRAQQEMGGQHPLLLLLPGVLALLVLRYVNKLLARRFRRRFNIGVTAAFAALAVLTLLAAVVSAGPSSDNDRLLTRSYRSAVDEATARTAANDAKSNESLRLIARGSGQAFEDAWQKASKVVADRASGGTGSRWQTYVAVHKKLVDLDAEGRWDDAVQLATTGRADGSTAALDAFDARSKQVVARAGAQTTAELRAGNTGILLLGIVTLLVALAAAGAAATGIAQRRKEYA